MDKATHEALQDTRLTWEHIDRYCNDGLSVILVNVAEGKKPAHRWKDAQSKQLSKDFLSRIISNSSSVLYPGIVTGQVSGNLEVIDIDVKNWPGIDAMFFAEIKEMYPSLFQTLRIHKTQSGGYHILYRCEEIGRNQKLATKNDSKEAAIETRGEGGYIVAPNAPGYTVFKDQPIPVISTYDRDALITIASNFNQKRAIVATAHKAGAKKDNIYTTSPFDDFNQSEEGASLLDNAKYNFVLCKETRQFKHYTRPGKDKGISVSYIKDRGLYNFFTTSTVFQPKCYSPVGVLAGLDFGFDYSLTYKHLVVKGFGNIKKEIELRMVQKAVETGYGLPTNLTPESRTHYNNLVKTQNSLYPFGVFWKEDDKGKLVIDDESIIRVSKGMGYREWMGMTVRIDGWRVRKLDGIKEWLDELKEYIRESDGVRDKEIRSAYERYMNKNGRYILSRMDKLDMSLVVQDKDGVGHMFFSNVWLRITEVGIEEVSYEGLDGLVFADKIIDVEWVRSDDYKETMYYKYLVNAVEADNPDSICRKVIGWFVHDYKDESMRNMVVLTEAVEDPMEGGGSGKNLFMNLLRGVTSVLEIPGYGLRMDDNNSLLRGWNGERVLVISDVKSNFNYEALKNNISNRGLLRKLYRDETSVSASDMPKVCVITNYSANIKDGGVKSRFIPVEFSDFYTLVGGVKAHHGCLFPGGWSDTDWLGYYNIIADCVVEYLRGGLRAGMTKMTDVGWRKMFVSTFGEEFLMFIEENMDRWISMRGIYTAELNNEYISFIMTHRTGYELKVRLRNRGLKDYCMRYGIDLKINTSIRRDSIVSKGYIFERIGDIADDGADVPF